MQGIDRNIFLELYILSKGLLAGVVYSFVYDILRIARRVISHNIIIINIEDIVYWIACSLCTFKLFYDYNGGIVRIHVICIILLGILLYHISISRVFVRYISLILTEIKNLVLKVLKKILFKVKIEKNIKDADSNERKGFGQKKKKNE